MLDNNLKDSPEIVQDRPNLKLLKPETRTQPTYSKRYPKKLRHTFNAPNLVHNRFYPHGCDKSFYFTEHKLHNIRMAFLITNIFHRMSDFYRVNVVRGIVEDMEYLTHWGWFLVIIFQFSVLILKPRGDKLKKWCSACHHSAVTIQIFIILMFWLALIPSALIEGTGSITLDFNYYTIYMGFFEHIFPAFTILFDYFVSKVEYSQHGLFMHTGIVIAYVVQSSL